MAFLLRVVKLSDLPSGFQNDEASFYYNAIAVAKTGMDEDGRFLPLYLNSFIDPKPALISYMQIPFILTLGESIFSARIAFALTGLMTIGVVVWLMRTLGVPLRIFQAVGVLMVISPWHILISRATQEVVTAFLFGMLALLFLAKSLENKKTTWWITTIYWLAYFGCLAVSEYLYHSSKVVLPLLSILIWWFMRKQASNRHSAVAMVLGGIGLTLLIGFGNQAGMARFKAVGLFADNKMQAVLSEQIALSSASTDWLLIRVLHNKVVYLVTQVADTYFAHFTVDFLFLNGGEPARYTIPFHGLLYSVELLVLCWGLVSFVLSTGSEKNRGWLFLGWLLISPVAAAFTVQEVPSVIRSFWMVVPLYYFIGVGLNRIIFGYKQGLLIGSLIVFWYLWGALYAWHQWTVFQPLYHPWHRNYADAQMARRLAEYEDDYAKIVISRFSGQPYIYLALEQLISLQLLQESYPERIKPVFSLGKYEFVSGDCPLSLQNNTLFIVRENCPLTSDYRVVDEVNYKDGNDGYLFVTLIQGKVY